MAYLYELVAKNEILKQKISEVKELLQKQQTDALAQELFGLLELKQANLMHIDKANDASTINIGGSDVKISVALRIRDTIKEQIDVLTSLIKNVDCTLDKLELQKQRDKRLDDYTLLSMGIIKNDLQVKVN